MATLLKGAPVSAAINQCSIERAEALKQQGIIPTLAILRVGERPDDLSYERGAMKKAAAAGVNVKNVVLAEEVDRDLFFDTLTSLNQDPLVHGILMLRPLPKHLDEKKACELLAPEKDVDGCTDGSLAGVFTNSARGFAPCTAQAAMEILHYYDIDVAGKKRW